MTSDPTQVDTLTLIRSAKHDLAEARTSVGMFLSYHMALQATLFELERRATKETERLREAEAALLSIKDRAWGCEDPYEDVAALHDIAAAYCAVHETPSDVTQAALLNADDTQAPPPATEDTP